MVSATRLDCVLGSAAGMRRGCVTAVHYAAHRQAFGKDLIAQPLMASVLADLTLEAEAATTLAIRLAGAADRAARGDGAEAALLRVTLPAAKHWICKRAPMHAAEALECLGGNGYVEESGMPRLYREAPLNSIWEGSGNVTALDLLRALRRQEGAADALAAELARSAGADSAAGRRGRAAAYRPGHPGRAARRGRGVRRPAAGRDGHRDPAGLAARPVRPGGGGGRVLRLAARLRDGVDGTGGAVRHVA